MEKEYLWDVWSKIFRKYTRDEDLILSYFDKIVLAYKSKERFYHNLTHIKHFIEGLQPYLHKTKNSDLLICAAFYHDVVYESLRTDNEEKSANLARVELKELGMERADRIKVMELIRRTANHNRKFHEDSYDVRLFLDADLKIISESLDRYKSYSENVRKEFIRIPDLIFNQKRLAFLQKMSEQKNIYCTPEYRTNFESSARENLQWEIEYLELKI